MTQVATDHNEFDVAVATYLRKFPLKVQVTIGNHYSRAFDEFYSWCCDNLGTRYKDWFLISHHKGTYTLYVTNPKWLSILALRFPDKVDSIKY